MVVFVVKLLEKSIIIFHTFLTDSKLASSGLDRDAIDNQLPAPFKSRLLARTERTIPVHTPGSIRAGQPPNQSGAPTPSDNRRKNSSLSDNNDVTESEKGTAVTACVICSLVEDSYLYITVDGVEKQLHAEALVHVNSLFLSGMILRFASYELCYFNINDSTVNRGRMCRGENTRKLPP